MTSDMPALARGQIRTLILCGSDPVGDWMADVIRFEPEMKFLGLVRDLSQVQPLIERLVPDVLLIDVSSGILQEAGLLNQLSAPKSGAAVILVAMMGEVDMIQKAMLHGAQGFLLKPFGEAELLNSIRQAYGLIVQRRAELSDLALLPPASRDAALPRASTVAVFGPKGGVGCTTIAINLAAALKRGTNQRSILVDGDLCFGDVDAALNTASTMSIATILGKLEEADDGLLDQMLTPHHSGIKIVPTSPYFDTAGSIHPDEIRRLLGRLAGLGPGYVVVDTWSNLEDCTLAILDCCQIVVVVTTPQVTALRDTHRFLDVMALLGYDLDRLLLVLNHCYHRSDVKLQDVERALGYAIAQVIEYTPGPVTASLNRGVLLVKEYRNSPAARNILDLAEIVAEKAEKQDSLGTTRRPPDEGGGGAGGRTLLARRLAG